MKKMAECNSKLLVNVEPRTLLKSYVSRHLEHLGCKNYKTGFDTKTGGFYVQYSELETNENKIRKAFESMAGKDCDYFKKDSRPTDKPYKPRDWARDNSKNRANPSLKPRIKPKFEYTTYKRFRE